MSVMLLLTLTGFSQKALAPDALQRKYKNYTESSFPVNKLSFDEWKSKHRYSEVVNNVISPGDYLIKAKNQIFGGLGCQVLAGCIIYRGASQQTANAYYVYAGALSLFGLGLEFSGILNIGRAGVSLNENGIGVKVKF